MEKPRQFLSQVRILLSGLLKLISHTRLMYTLEHRLERLLGVVVEEQILGRPKGQRTFTFDKL